MEGRWGRGCEMLGTMGFTRTAGKRKEGAGGRRSTDRWVLPGGERDGERGVGGPVRECGPGMLVGPERGGTGEVSFVFFSQISKPTQIKLKQIQVKFVSKF